jgi:3',5'-cyclic AMP phosphodiesterase CpdA
MATLLHISDLHFGTEDPAVAAALRRLSRELGPDAVILSGDITQRARSAQFEAARAFCDSLSAPRLLSLPGNHDIPLFNLAARIADPYGGYRAAFGAELEPELTLADAVIVGVNTTRASRHKDGEVSREQVLRVARRLEQVPPDRLRVVVTHQPACVLRPEDEKDRLHGGADAMRAWSEAGADLVLGGHIHLPYVSDVCSLVQGTHRTMYCVQAGTAVSTRVRHGTPNSVNVIRWDAAALPRAATVERWDFDLADDRFELTHAQQLALAA